MARDYYLTISHEPSIEVHWRAYISYELLIKKPAHKTGLMNI